MSPGTHHLSELWHSACDQYAQETGISIDDAQFPKLNAPEDLARQLDLEKDTFEDFRAKKKSLLHVMQTIATPFEVWGNLVADAAVAACPPATSIMGAMLLLIRGSRKVSQAFDGVVDLFQRLSNFALRLESYKGISLSGGMKHIIAKVMVNALRVCATSQKLVARGSLKSRLSKWAKNVFFEDTTIASLLNELEELTSQEHKMISAHSLSLTHQAVQNTTRVLERNDNRDQREVLAKIKSSLNPVAASGQVLSAISESRMPNSGRWIEDRIRAWWQASEPLLWIHGGPAVGKSFLASKIINDLVSGSMTAGTVPIVASFFCKNNDVDLCSLNKGIRTLVWQVVTQRSDFLMNAEDFCLKDDPSDTYKIWKKLLFNYFDQCLPDLAGCVVIDGVDEIDPVEQDILFTLLEKAYAADSEMSRLRPLRFILLSRDSVRGLFEEHDLGWVPEIEIAYDQNHDDLYRYVATKLQRTRLFRAPSEFGDEIVRNICEQAEGLWEWANLVMKSVLRCRTKEQIRLAIKTMPRGISAMLQIELERLERELSDKELFETVSNNDETPLRVKQLNVILSFVTVAKRPLTIEHLECILEVLLGEEVLCLEDDLRTIYSSLLMLREVQDDEGRYMIVITFRHSSFYEFFRTSAKDGPVCIDTERAEAAFVYVLLNALQKGYEAKSQKHLKSIKKYAERSLPMHLECASPEKAAELREKISFFLEALFTDPSNFDWLFDPMYVKEDSRYIHYPRCRANHFACYWWDCGDRQLMNQRAQLVLNWLTPEAKEQLRNCAQSSPIANATCSFAVLFSFIATSMHRLWLLEDTDESVSLHASISPNILFIYAAMAGRELPGYHGHSSSNGDATTPTLQEIPFVSQVLSSQQILFVAELQQVGRDALWQVRLAQTYLLEGHFQASADAFQLCLDEDLSGNSDGRKLTPRELYMVHRDMSHACVELGLHQNAIQHATLAESLGDDNMRTAFDFRALALLNIAHMENSARMPDRTLSTASRALEVFSRSMIAAMDLLDDFFALFLELQQPQLIRRALEGAYLRVKDVTIPDYDFAHWLGDAMMDNPQVTYYALSYAITADDEKYLDSVRLIPDRIRERVSDEEESVEINQLVANIIHEKGRDIDAMNIWYHIVTDTEDHGDMGLKSRKSMALTLLARSCLSLPATSNYELIGAPLILDTEAELANVCLVISRYLRDNGNGANARRALSSRVKRGMYVLSEDLNPFFHGREFLMLFTAFLITPGSEEDLNAALFIIKWISYLFNYYTPKKDTEGQTPNEQDKSTARKPESGDKPSIQETSNTRVVSAAENNETSNDDGVDSDDEYMDRENHRRRDNNEWRYLWPTEDDPAECAKCKTRVRNIEHWWFCRSCPFSAFCRKCYSEIRSSPGLSHNYYSPSLCSPQHQFFYTGRPIRHCQLDWGEVPLSARLIDDTAASDVEVISDEEWLERLAKKWDTNRDVMFEGGLNAWCLRVLSGETRERWAAMFK